MKRVAVLVVVVVAAGVLTGCRHGSPDPAPGEARLLERSGTVEVSADGRTWKRAHDGTLHRGERLRVGGGGRAVLALAQGARVELRERSQVAVGRPLRLVTGDLLVRAGDGAEAREGATEPSGTPAPVATPVPAATPAPVATPAPAPAATAQPTATAPAAPPRSAAAAAEPRVASKAAAPTEPKTTSDKKPAPEPVRTGE
jgi:hypothetical protein